MKRVLAELQCALQPASLFPQPPVLRFYPTLSLCPICGTELKVQKTLKRSPQTLHIGLFVAHETVLHCQGCSSAGPFRSEELAALVAPKCIFGYDVMTFAGLSLWRECRTVEATVAALREQHVEISASEVRDLAARFTIRLSIAHAESSQRLKQHLQMAGGYILHVDSTTAGGGPHLLTGLDELSGFVLLNARIATENAADVETFLQTLKARFGPPVAVCSDMGKAIGSALASVFDGVPHFICHFHFLRDIGKDLLGDTYGIIRQQLRLHGPKAALNRLLAEVREPLHTHAKALDALLDALRTQQPIPAAAQALPYEVILGALITKILDAEHRGDGCGFPFDRPHLDIFQQARTCYRDALLIKRHVSLQPPQAQLHQRLMTILQPMVHDEILSQAADKLDLDAVIFDRLRQAMRIAEPGAAQGLNDPGDALPIGTIEQRVNDFCAWARGLSGYQDRPAIAAMLAQIERYRKGLFAKPLLLVTANGIRTVQPQRTNNILECLFRRIKRAASKRTGERPAAAFLQHLLPDTTLVLNLDNPEYLHILLDGSSNLTERLARVDAEEVEQNLKELRKPQSGLNRRSRLRLRLQDIPADVAIEILKHAS